MTNPLSTPHAWNLVSDGYLEHNMDIFEHFAELALASADVRRGQRIVDVATGPGSLAVLAAQRGAEVEAVDFSPQMLELAKARCSELGLASVNLREADGQALPFDDASFQAGFCMFGLMFFPDRGKGLLELRRVLEPGGKAVIASWVPMDDIQILKLLFEGVFSAAPELAPSGPPPAPPPLSNVDAVREEMSAAGFRVEVEQSTQMVTAPNLNEFLVSSRSSFAPLCLMEEQLGSERFDHVLEQTHQHIEKSLGEGPVEFPMCALLGVGTAI